MGSTPSQTVGSYLSIGLPWLGGPYVVPEGEAERSSSPSDCPEWRAYG